MFKINNRNTRTRCEIFSNLIIKTPERRQWQGISTVNFEQVNAGWEKVNFTIIVTTILQQATCNFDHYVGRKS